MVLRVLRMTTLSLLLLVWSIGASIAKLDCDNKDAAACKMEFVHKLDKKFLNVLLHYTKLEMQDVSNVFKMTLKELPENQRNAQLLRDAIEALNKDLIALEENKDDYPKLRNITDEISWHMQPHVRYAPDDKNFEKILERHNYTQIMERFDMIETCVELAQAWTDVFKDLRQSDLKEYPEYNEINEFMKKMLTEKDETKSQDIFRKAFKKLRQFCEIPSLEILVFHSAVKT